MGFYTSVLPWGNSLLVRGVDDKGKRFTASIRYKPTLYIPETKPTSQFKTLEGKPVAPITFGNIHKAREWMETRDNSNLQWYGFELFQYVYIHETYPGEVKFDPAKIKVTTIDIEVAADKGFPDINVADKAITAITVKTGNQTVAFGCGEFTSDKTNVYYYRGKDEKQLLECFLAYWEQLAPDVVTGWNISRFDIPYIINRLLRVLNEESAQKLSPWKKIQPALIESNGTKIQVPYPVGIAVLDYMDLYKSKKFVQEMRESYSLNFIAYTELKEKKLDFTEYSSLVDLYEKNFQKFMEYNIHDVELVDRLEKKLGLIQQLFVIAYWGKINYGDVLGSVRQWDVIIHNYLIDRRIVVPPKKKLSYKPDIIGAYVKETQCKMHGWFASLDLDSLYPHLIMQFNISPETYRGQLDTSLTIDELLEGKLDAHKQGLVEQNITCAGNLATYTRERKGFLPEILEEMYRLRVEYKQNMLQAEKEYQQTKNPEAKERAIRFKNTQKAIKVNLNAAYGVLTNAYFRYYNQHNAEAVTLSGQLAIRWILDRLNAYMNKLLKTEGVDYIIAGDTDSVYLSLDRLVQSIKVNDNKSVIVEFINSAIEQGITPLIKKWFNELAEYNNCIENRMSMKRESICFLGSTVIETKSGRKAIKNIQVGDLVLTHKGRYQPVTKVLKTQYTGHFIELTFRKGFGDLRARLKATPKHPILVERDNELKWIPFDEVVEGEVVFVKAKKCSKTGRKIPPWQKRYKTWNAVADDPTIREKSFVSRNIKPAIRVRANPNYHKHASRHIIPFCQEMQNQGWSIVPIGTNVIPDAVGFKNGQIVLFELEATGGALYDFKKQKYKNAPIMEFVDDVRWITLKVRKGFRGYWYEDGPTEFVKVKVQSTAKKQINWPYRRKYSTVYNLEVKYDHSYVANHVVVHNCDKGVWTGKKHYILNVWDKEGVRFKEPEIEIKGIESVRSTTPDCCRTKIKEAIKILMNHDEATMIKFIEDFRAEFDKMRFEEVATPTGVNDLRKYSDADDVYKKGTPMHVKGALIHNDLVKKLKLTHIELINSSDKIKYTALVEPNGHNISVIAAKNFLPAEFKLERYINRDALFDKGFLMPVKRILDVVGWKTEHEDTLEKWFA